MQLRERARCGYPDAMAALAEAGEDLSFLSAEQRAYGWCHTFHPRLAEELVVCRATPHCLVVSSLKLGQPLELDSRLAPYFLEASACPDPEVSARALEALKATDLVDLLCDYALSRDCSPAAREVWVALGLLPSAPHRRQIYLIRMGRTDLAEELDPQGEHLTLGALELRPSWRLALAAHLRERGRGHLVPRMLGIVRERVQLDGPMLAEMLRQAQFEALWTLCPFLSAERAREVILGLAERGFAGGADFAQAVDLARVEPIRRPVYRTRGKWVGWGGRRLLVSRNRSVRAIDWEEDRIAWQVGGSCQGAVLSPDGRWAALSRQRHYHLHDHEGRMVHANRAVMPSFSPCSNYFAFREGRWQLWRLSPLELLESSQNCKFEWLEPGQVILSEVGGLRIRDLASGTTRLEPPLASEPNTSKWRRSARGARWVARRNPLMALSTGTPESLIVESDGSCQVVPSRVVLLDDERVLCTKDWKIWDGRMLRPLPRPEAASFQIDPRGARLVTEKEGFTALVRLGDRLPYRELPGTFLAIHPTEPYLATLLEGEICIWRVPHEVDLGPALLEDNAERLEQHLRPLALFLLHRRFRHEVALEEGLELSPAHEIQLDDDEARVYGG